MSDQALIGTIERLFTFFGFAAVVGMVIFSFLTAIGLDSEVKQIDSAIRDLRERVEKLEGK